jgi:MYXO-CTERM domain-containing protein
LDVDRDELSYTLRIFRDDESAEVIWEQAGLLIAPGSGAVPEGQHLAELELDPAGYLVSARAVDDTGLEGPWGPANGFVVLATPGPGIDLEDFGSGCACSVGSPKSSPPLWFLAFLLTVLAPLRRRRLADDGAIASSLG